ncbi:hypothetical protein [Floridanema aerugineum]|uniref:Lipoprotein n=1 Tax=Floridaenema aerugineum BLCC-F46 TaxID=3153654 RepID=A0ABV4X3Y3_9CYAN
MNGTKKYFNSIGLIILLLVQFIAGCGEKSPNLSSTSTQTPVPTSTQTPVPTVPPVTNVQTPVAQEDANDPKIVRERFEQKLKEDIERISPKLKEKRSKTYSDQTYVYTAEYAGKQSFDIKKSDSIVSPYIAVARYYINWYANGKIVPGTMYIQANYAYQDGQWVFKDAMRFSEDKANTEPEIIAWANSLFQ